MTRAPTTSSPSPNTPRYVPLQRNRKSSFSPTHTQPLSCEDKSIRAVPSPQPTLCIAKQRAPFSVTFLGLSPPSHPPLFFFNLLSSGQPWSANRPHLGGLLPVSLACTLVSALEVCVPFPPFLQGVGTCAQGSAENAGCAAARIALQRWGAEVCRQPAPLTMYSVAHSCQVCCGDKPVKFFFFLMPPFVLSPGVRERCLASHSSSDGHPSPYPTTSPQCGFPSLPPTLSLSLGP